MVSTFRSRINSAQLTTAGREFLSWGLSILMKSTGPKIAYHVQLSFACAMMVLLKLPREEYTFGFGML